MATTNVLLREDVDNLGARGEIVKVKAGFARNYLLPRNLAVEATPGNVRQIEGERKALLKREARERATAEAQQAQMKDLHLTFERKVGEHGMLYGSVTSMHIAEALREKGYEVDRRRVHLQEPIKETGEFTVAVRLHRDVNVEIPVTVAGEGGAQTSGTAEAATEETTGGEATAGVEANEASTENT
jgi:large subunit ribosomal protein L9